MKFNNRYQTPSPTKPKWELTADGFLRCKARVLASRVMAYGKDELGEIPDDFVGDVVNMLVHMDDMSAPESIRSLEGAPIVAGEHNWLSPEVVRGFGVGSVAGTPYIDGEYLVCDLMITDPSAIESVQAGELPEISAAYLAESIFTPGTQGDSPYDAMQKGINYNHIAILPEGHGRAGRDVKIFNKSKVEKEESIMPEELTHKVRLKNSGLSIMTNEDGAKAIEAEETMNEEAVEVSSTNLESTMGELESKNGELKTLQAECEELKGELSVYKEKLDELLTGDAVEVAAGEMMEEQGEASEILENADITDEKGEPDEEKKEELENSIKGLRGTALHSAVLSGIGIKIENMTPPELKGAFKAQHQIRNTMRPVAVAGAGMVGKTIPLKIENTQPAQRTAQQKLGFPAA